MIWWILSYLDHKTLAPKRIFWMFKEISVVWFNNYQLSSWFFVQIRKINSIVRKNTTTVMFNFFSVHRIKCFFFVLFSFHISPKLFYIFPYKEKDCFVVPYYTFSFYFNFWYDFDHFKQDCTDFLGGIVHENPHSWPSSCVARHLQDFYRYGRSQSLFVPPLYLRICLSCCQKSSK